ncbi:hypothetical protein [uncultured Selenomonas sp.]|uniref:hypothetical protein n=1 Tax=uncultured Selenomonas sp. TaxID=159275 RepID=UPI0025D282F4|nr:hypothetical protein [uncultured Selenomonas sp.]
MNREHQYYKINRLLKKSYHARIRAGEAADIYETYRWMNEEIVALFHHGGLIDGVAAEALGHHHGASEEHDAHEGTEEAQ